MKQVLAYGVVALAVCLAVNAVRAIEFDPDKLPPKKQTTLGLYSMPQEAYNQVMEKPDSVYILDVRTPEEYYFVGHAPMAYNIPLMFMQYQYHEPSGKPVMKPNPDFVDEVQAKFPDKNTVIHILCRSGTRTAKAVNMLAAEGYSQVYAVVYGFSGEKITDEESYYKGKRMKNGWVNACLPWTYDLAPVLMYLKENDTANLKNTDNH